MENKNIEKELTTDFENFLHTKGLKAKFKLAFTNMKESAILQHEKDVKAFNEVKAKSIEENKDFYEFLKTKGFKAKVNLVIENIKKGAKESKEKTKSQIEASKNLANPYRSITKDELNKEFTEFLKTKGLDKQFSVTIEELN